MSGEHRPADADVPSASGQAWKLTLPCTRDEAEAIDVAAIEDDVVLMTSEIVEDDRERWQLDAYVDREPDPALIARLRALAPSGGMAPVIERLDNQDWVTLSQAGLHPIREGRFAVHTAAHPVAPLPGGRAFLIEASRAFGTGHHATTAGCLAMLDAMADQGFDNVIDVGTGTGLLAFAARHLWPRASVTATDIDPIAIEVTRENAAINDVAAIDLIVADGALHEAIVARAPFDLLIANVLAGPLVSMAPELAAIAAPGATIVLAGLLDRQEDGVAAAYRACGCSVEQADRRGDWTILRLAAGHRRFVPSTPPDPRGRDGWALDL